MRLTNYIDTLTTAVPSQNLFYSNTCIFATTPRRIRKFLGKTDVITTGRRSMRFYLRNNTISLFILLGVLAYPLNGVERLRLMYPKANGE